MSERVMIAVPKELAVDIDEIAKSIHFTSRSNVIAMLVRNYTEESK